MAAPGRARGGRKATRTVPAGSPIPHRIRWGEHDAVRRLLDAGGYSASHQRRLGERLREFRPDQATADPFELLVAPQALRRPGDRLQRLFRAHRSTREVGPEPMSARQLGTVPAALAEEDGRAHPSAGGLDPLRCYAILRNVHHGLNGRVVRYDAQRRAVQDVGPAPDWVRLREVPAADTEPALVPALVLADQPVLVGQGQRGGRFGRSKQVRRPGRSASGWPGNASAAPCSAARRTPTCRHCRDCAAGRSGWRPSSPVVGRSPVVDAV